MTHLLFFLAVVTAEPEIQKLKISGASGCPAVPVGLPVPPGIPPAAEFYKRRILLHLHEEWGLGRASLIFAQIHQESGFDCKAQSPQKAAGLAQFIPSTARLMQNNTEYAKQLVKYCSDEGGCPFDPDWALRALVLLDKEDYQRYKSASGDERYAFMLADYNGGNVALRDEIKICKLTKGCIWTAYFGHVQSVCGQVVPPTMEPSRAAENCKQNREYVRIILKEYRPRYARWLPPGQ